MITKLDLGLVTKFGPPPYDPAFASNASGISAAPNKFPEWLARLPRARQQHLQIFVHHFPLPSSSRPVQFHLHLSWPVCLEISFTFIFLRISWVYGTSQYSINRKSSSGADDLIYSADQLSAKIDLIHQTFDEYLVTLYKAKQGRKLHQNHRKLARSQTKCEFSQGRRFGKLMGNLSKV
ncbi:hypothetical protein B0H10DRAFT_1962711 [Mycena sp. CBHHK59/15]|nr:hypothetical protein B0H10DRAFT_1962711 [Mycena sp. CBHHK59/15]